MTKKKKKTQEDKDWELLKGDYRAMAYNRSGRRVLWHILSLCNIYSDTFTGNSQTFFLEGQRSIGLAILGVLDEIDPELYPTMLLENAKENLFKEEEIDE